jgi:hypothetical protein
MVFHPLKANMNQKLYSGKLVHLSEDEKLELRLKLSHEERFFKLLRLIKIGRMLMGAKVTHHQDKK